MIIGIDPGITGAVAVLEDSGEFVAVVDIPIMAHGKGKAKVKNQVDAAGLARYLEQWPGGVILELVGSMPGQGVASMFSMGDSFGCIRGVCAALRKPVDVVTPQSWKKVYKLGGDKEQVRARAIELFPAAPLSRKKDHNRAEALLIARHRVERLEGLG